MTAIKIYIQCWNPDLVFIVSSDETPPPCLSAPPFIASLDTSLDVTPLGKCRPPSLDISCPLSGARRSTLVFVVRCLFSPSRPWFRVSYSPHPRTATKLGWKQPAPLMRHPRVVRRQQIKSSWLIFHFRKKKLAKSRISASDLIFVQTSFAVLFLCDTWTRNERKREGGEKEIVGIPKIKSKSGEMTTSSRPCVGNQQAGEWTSWPQRLVRQGLGNWRNWWELQAFLTKSTRHQNKTSVDIFWFSPQNLKVLSEAEHRKKFVSQQPVTHDKRIFF